MRGVRQRGQDHREIPVKYFFHMEDGVCIRDRVARQWMHTATGIERRLDDGWDLVCPDLKRKLD